ncbi:MAG: hypothetical protein HY583_02490, partial [Candidatus Omnitrophica bacterium]|nr:hypothetical protein [Candidatus Omnitrophota bacterium]
MKTLKLYIFLILCVSAVYTKMALGQSWEPVSRLPIQGRVEFVAVHPAHSDFLFIGANGNLYASYDQGKNWKRLIGLGGSDAKINRLYFDRDRMFLLSSEGLFESKTNGKNWKKIFRGRGKEENNVLSLSRDPKNPKKIYLGTAGGLYLSQDNGRTFQKEANELSRQLIQSIETDYDNGELFIAGERGLYRMIQHRNRLDRVYVTHAPEKFETESEVGNNPNLEISQGEQVRTILITNRPSPALVIGTQKGVLISEDEGNQWERLPLSGLRDTQILDL